MSSKRKGDDLPAKSGREKKKHKTAAARTIAVQPVSTTPRSQNAAAGPSRTVQFDTGPPLPGSLDVERFAEARSFEINAMHTAMQTARASGTQRAWQQLPRHLRRRAASHDVRRVPLRLREKAKAEMDPPKAQAGKKSVPKRGKAKEIKRTDDFLKRQRDKAWLETHIWHAKRMHMENKWGYRLAVTPTEKSFRPSHRASIHGSILHDASYFGLIEIKAAESVLKAMFDSCCDLQAPSPAAKRYLAGARTCETHIYHRGTYPFGLLAPIKALWRPLTSPVDSPADNNKNPAKQSRKGKEREIPPTQRTVWVWVHPSAYEAVYLELRVAASFALEQVQEAKPEVPWKLEMADLREQVNIFEIMGPKSSQVIRGALRPLLSEERAEFKQCWDELSHLQTPASVPRNAVLGVTVYDPRLSFPPKNAKVVLDKTGLPSAPHAATGFYPTSVLAQSSIWDENVRRPLQKPHLSNAQINQRRSKNLVPGAKLQAQHYDGRIPILLIQRSIEADNTTSAGSSSLPSHSQGIHGWTLIIPAGWAMPFFSSLTHTGTRVGGQLERQTQAFESGRPYYPHDYPCTMSYEDYADDNACKEEETWDRKPPAKRPNYKKLGTRSPWRADWEVVLGLEGPSADAGGAGDESTIPGEFVPAQRDENPMDEDAPAAADAVPDAVPDVEMAEPETADPPQDPRESVHPWLLRGPKTHDIIATVASAADRPAALLAQINALRQSRGGSPLEESVSAADLWQRALVRVRLRLCGRGCPQNLAVIYGMDDGEAGRWIKAEQVRKKGVTVGMDEVENETELSILVPPQETIIGYVTTGSYSLSLGEGSAIGAIPVARLMEVKDQAQRLATPTMLLVKVRDRHEAICRAACIEVLE